MDKKSWETKRKQTTKLNPEEEKYFWKTLYQSEVKISDMQSLELYNDFVGRQKEEFVSALYKVNEILEKLKLEGKISEYAKWYARIKHFENAMKNEEDNKSKKGLNKALDDVFGVRIVGASERELLIIQDALEVEFSVGAKKKDSSNMLYNLTKISEILKECSKEISERPRRTKAYSILGEIFDVVDGGISKAKEQLESIYEKENRKKTSREKGYNAKHRYYYLPQKQNSPMIEFQFWTVELDYRCTFGDLSYSNYKDVSREEIQSRYDKGEFKIGNNVSIIYDGPNADGRIEPLSSTAALKKTYPFLNMKKKEEDQR